MKSKYDTKEYDNIYALTGTGKIIFIGDAESGRKGYYCRGCQNPMLAIKRKVIGWRSYFRHDVKDVAIEQRCTYKSETYRHQLAKEFLQLNKFIKLPPVYKFSPDSKEKNKFLLQPARIATASSVGIEYSFFEDENGEIRFSKDKTAHKNLLICPDVTFFDEKGKPFLLIELNATHKVDDEKKVKLMRLGIDTVQVDVPKDSPENIAAAFKISEHTNWLYNHEEHNTPYLSITGRPDTTVSPDDDYQRKLLGESFFCRQAFIGNLIRSIRRCLESEQYGSIKSAFELEIQRVENNTEQFEKQWGELQERIRAELDNKYNTEEEDLRRAEETISGKLESLEGRYLKKRRELEETTGKLIAGNAKFQHLVGERREKLTREEEDLDREIERIDQVIEQESRQDFLSDFDPDPFASRLEEEIRGIEKQISELPEKHADIETRIRAEYASKDAAYGPTIASIEEGIKYQQGQFESDREELERFYETKGKRILEANVGNIGEFDGDFGRDLQNLYSDLELLKDYQPAKVYNHRIRQAIQAINTKAYENWV